MSSIRKQSIQSSIIVYIGFAVGALNMYLYTKQGSFTAEQFGLTRIFFDVAQNVFALASLGVAPVLYKFYPYYKDNLADKDNDLLTLVLVTSVVGFVLVIIAGIILQPLVVTKFGERSTLFLDFYFLIFPFSFGYLIFSILEAYCWALQRTVVTNSLKETAVRLITTVFIVLYLFSVINFQQFIWLFTTLYIIIMLLLVFYLRKNHLLRLTFSISRVTKKYWKKMVGLQFFVFGGIVINAVAITVSTFLIASREGLGAAGVYNLATYVATLIEIPQRSIVSISTGVLSRAWKEKNFADINRVYHRSSINMLILATFIFGNVWLNVSQGIQLLHIQNEYLAGLSIVFVLGIAKIIDAGTGVNSVILATSTFWKFEFFSGIILLGIRIPLAYVFVQKYGIIGPAYSELISQTVYNFVRFEFLRRKFNMQPFNKETLYSLVLGVTAIAGVYYLLGETTGWAGIIVRTTLFSTIMIAGVFLLKLTPDALQLVDVTKNKIADWRKQ